MKPTVHSLHKNTARNIMKCKQSIKNEAVLLYHMFIYRSMFAPPLSINFLCSAVQWCSVTVWQGQGQGQICEEAERLRVPLRKLLSDPERERETEGERVCVGVRERERVCA